jgi:two-component system NtrC family sensor kinase
VTVDPDLIRATVLNLLLNAAQAVGGNGEVHVATAARDGNWTIAVRDNGPGIPLDIREQVLEPFFTTKARGGGLGLPIARRVAELHGGTLTLAFPSDGGTSVTVQAPRKPPAQTV